MPLINLDGHDYDVYVTVEDADVYLDGQISADTWRAADDDVKKRSIISSTRLIDRQQWQGEKTDEYQVHAFPRTGLTYPDGRDVPSETVPQEVVDACCELASALLDGSTVQDSMQPGESLVQSLRAGSVAISYFRSPQGLGERFPTVAQELLAFWLASNRGVSPTIATGTCGRDRFRDEFDVNQGL